MALATSREADETNGNILFLFLLYHAILFCQIKFVKIFFVSCLTGLPARILNLY